MATVTNISAAADVSDIYTITIGGTWTTNETLTIECGSTRGVTIDTGASGSTVTADIAAEVAAILVATHKRDGNANNYDWSAGGLEYPEFNEIENVSVSGSVVTVEGPLGKPITITGSETSASGTVTVANPQSATGKYFWDNADNWDTGSVPVTGDDVVYNHRSLGTRYNHPTSNFDPASITVTQEFAGPDRWIGLPALNQDDPTRPYTEYRARYLVADDAADETGTITIGQGAGRGAGLVNIDWQDKDDVDLYVFNTGPQTNISRTPVNIKGSSTTFTVSVSGGFVSLAPLASDAAYQGTTLLSGANSLLVLGPGVTIDSGGTSISITDGTLDNCSTGTNYALTMNGGTYIENRASYAAGTYEVYGGRFLAKQAAAATSLRVGGPGVVDLSDFNKSAAFTNTYVTAGGTILDPRQLATFTNGIQYINCGLEDANIQLGKHLTITPS